MLQKPSWACRNHPKMIGWHLKLLTSLTKKERPGCLAICRCTRHFMPNPRKAIFTTNSSGPIILPPRPKKLQCGQLKDAFCNFRHLRSTRPRISSPVALADGTLVTDKSQKLSCLKDHFSNFVNRPPAPLSEDLVSAASTAPVDPAISRAPPSEEEVQRPLNQLKNKSTRHMQHSPRAAELWGHELHEMAHFHLSV